MDTMINSSIMLFVSCLILFGGFLLVIFIGYTLWEKNESDERRAAKLKEGLDYKPYRFKGVSFFNLNYLIFLYFSPKGRINRRRFIIGLLVIFIPYAVLAFYSLYDYPQIIPLVYGYMHLSLCIKRAHALNYSGHFCWLLLIPVIGLIPLARLMSVEGTCGDNRFGADPLL